MRRSRECRYERFVAAILLMPFFYFTSAHATCIESGNTQQFVAAMDAASHSSAPAVIKLEQGTYGDAASVFVYEVAPNLTIIGGYLPTPAHTCTQREYGAGKTRISFSYLELGTDDGLIDVEDLTLGPDSPPIFGTLSMGGSDSNRLRLRNVRVTALSSTAPVQLGYWVFNYLHGVGTTDIELTNVQFDHVVGVAPEKCAVEVLVSGFADVTMNHVTADLSGGNFCFEAGDVGGSKRIALWNSIFWDRNAGFMIKALHDLSDDEMLFDVYDVDFPDFSVSPSDSITFDPHFPSGQFNPLWTNPDAGDYSILNSPAANAGTENNPGGDPLHSDIVGNARPIGSAPDMGAYESPFDDYSRVFTVTNTNDVTDVNSPQYLGSLRWALASANAGTDAALIKFALPACPSTILLNTSLPEVWVPLEIDGYSSPGARPNSDPGHLSNAILCVALEPASTQTTPSAFIVPSGAHDVSLAVRGIGFGAFAQAIQLAGGREHRIVGNQFGGLMGNVQLFGSGVAAVHVEAIAPVIIGGSDPADRNVFLNVTSFAAGDAAAILVGSFANNEQRDCQIIGNLFGVAPDGSSAVQGNENGILIRGRGCAVLDNYIAGSSRDAIRIEGGSRNVVQYNVIGPAPTFGQDFSNPGIGIHITSGATDNIIGAGDGFYGPVYSYQNTITDMDAGGIVISGSTGNTARGNAIYANGLASGLNLDLGGDGPTPNDPGDIDGGPGTANELINFPMPHAITWGTQGPPDFGAVGLTVGGSLDVPVGSYLIDAYYDVICSPTGRGGGTWVGGGTYAATLPGIGAFSLPVHIPFFGFDSAVGRISLTVTSNGTQQSTSEFSRCVSVDTIFSDSFER